MKTTTQILTILIILTLTGCFIQNKTRKPKSDLKTQTLTIEKIDERIQVSQIEVIKIDTTLNLFKGESLIGITVKGIIKTVNDPEMKSKYYFERLDFIETVEDYNRKISIELIPLLRHTNPNLKKDKPTKNEVKYNRLPNKTEFEFYVEKRIYISGFGEHEVDIRCGQVSKKISFFRRK